MVITGVLCIFAAVSSAVFGTWSLSHNQTTQSAAGTQLALRAMAPPELCRRNAGLHGKLLDGVGDAEIAQRRTDLRIHVADPVEKEELLEDEAQAVGAKAGEPAVDGSLVLSPGMPASVARSVVPSNFAVFTW